MYEDWKIKILDQFYWICYQSSKINMIDWNAGLDEAQAGI